MSDNTLPSWNDTKIKKSIIEFVQNAVKEGSPGFIPEEDRIAVFDNDGTLWTEQPLQVQIFYCLDRIKTLGKANPALVATQPLKAFYEQDWKTIFAMTKQEIFTFFLTTLDGKTPEDYEKLVLDWFEKGVHPKFKFSYYNSAFIPQLELLRYLEDNGFKIFIVSGGGIDFMRAVSEKIYGIKVNRVIGSSSKLQTVYEGTKPVINRLLQLGSFNDKTEKVNNIHLHIGKRPVFAFGNSDGDLAMIRYTLSGDGAKIAFLLHHDDNEREVAYDKDFKLSPLVEGLEVAAAEGINLVSMKNDWNEIFGKDVKNTV